MPKFSKHDLEHLIEKLTMALGDQIVHATTHIEKLFPPTELSQWMDKVGEHMGTWYHRVKHGHDVLNADLVYKKFGVDGLIKYPFELGKDALTPHGIPLPGVQALHQNGYVNARTATEWLSFNVGDMLVGSIAIYSTYKLYKKTKSEKLSKREIIWASVGCITKVTAGVVSQHPVLIISAFGDGLMIIEDQFQIKAKLSELLEIDVDSVLSRALKATAAGAVAGGIVATGAFTATAAFASASTGTAIASLSGVAATNATLAALGGGALSVGGLGMLGGMLVLGSGFTLIAAGTGAAVWAYRSRAH